VLPAVAATPAVGQTAAAPVGFRLDPGRTPVLELVRDTWRSRTLVVALARKNFYVQYRRASLGMAWAGLLPLIQAAAMTVAFAVVVRVKVPSVPYPVFVFTALIGWSFLNGTVQGASTAIVDGAGMASRIYFPRAVLPLIQVVSAMYNWVISLVLLIAMAIGFGYGIDWHIVYVVPAAVLMVTLTSGFVLVFSALHVYFRDLRYVIAAALNAWFYLTPVAYPLSYLSDHPAIKTLIICNPATGVIEAFRAAFIHQPASSPGASTAIVISCVWAVGLLVVAAVLHARYDRNFADLL
jgi:lipopolysaccharide transport system permease protein